MVQVVYKKFHDIITNLQYTQTLITFLLVHQSSPLLLSHLSVAVAVGQTLLAVSCHNNVSMALYTYSLWV